MMVMSVFVCGVYSANGQLAFTDSNTNLNLGGMYSGCAVTVTDVNFDGMDDVLRMDQGHRLYISLQNRDGSYTTQFLYDIGSSSAWAMTCADVDQNGWKDAVMDGDGGIMFVKLFESGGTVTTTVSTLQNSGFFLQNASFCDFNNDGWIDLFCCDDNAAAHMYLNDGAGNLNISTMVNFAVNPGINYGGDPADSGNYGSAWIDFDNDGDLDLYVAHCRQSTSSPTDLRRINRMFVNDGSNNFTEQANAYGIDIGWQTWTSSFGDLDNDGDLDLVLTNHDHTSQIFQNDGSGHYTELLSTGFHTNAITPIESVVEDFDNDGFADILVTGSEWMFWKNNGDLTFTQLNGLFANNGMLSFASGDLNHDGFIDIYASYGDIYTDPTSIQDVAYLNNRNSNHFITFDLRGTVSNKGAIGGRATIYGPWGVQVREIRAGESYGTCNSSQLHFGLGNNVEVDSAVIWFPSGITTTLYNLNANQFVTVVEAHVDRAGFRQSTGAASSHPTPRVWWRIHRLAAPVDCLNPARSTCASTTVTNWMHAAWRASSRSCVGFPIPCCGCCAAPPAAMRIYAALRHPPESIRCALYSWTSCRTRTIWPAIVMPTCSSTPPPTTRTPPHRMRSGPAAWC